MQWNRAGIKNFCRSFMASWVFKFFLSVVVVTLILFDFYRGFYLSQVPEKYSFLKVLALAFVVALGTVLIVFSLVKLLLKIKNIFLCIIVGGMTVFAAFISLLIMFYIISYVCMLEQVDLCVAKCLQSTHTTYEECRYDTCDPHF